MEIKTIYLEDVYPYEKNPREDFGDIDALAESIEATGCQPVNPIVVIQDGGIYRIVDGERRYRAMKKLRTYQCRAVVCDDWSEADTAVAAVATDDKKQLTEEERSMGFQTMLQLGVADEKAEKAAGAARGTAARVRRAAKSIGEDATQMTLDRLIAVDEFAEAGDEDTAKRLAECDERDWERIATDARRKRDNLQKAAEIVAALEGAGVRPMTDEERQTRYREWHCLGSAPSVKRVGDLLELGSDAGNMAYTDESDEWGVAVYVYEPRGEVQEDPETAARHEKEGRIREAAASYTSRLFAWFEPLRCRFGQAPAVKELAEGAYLKAMDERLSDYADFAGIQTPIDGEVGDYGLAIGFETCHEDWSNSAYAIATGSLGGWRTDAYKRGLDLYEAAKADGFHATDEDEQLHAAVREGLEGTDE